MNQFATSLESIESGLLALGRQSAVAALAAGLNARQVHELLASEGLAAPDEFAELYGWHNGMTISDTSVLDDVQLFPGFYFLSLEDAFANLRAFRSDGRWHAKWLPVFANGGGDFYVVDLSQADAGPVRHFRIEYSVHPVEFNSLSSMFATINKAIEQGIVCVDEAGYLEMDDFAFGRIASDLNPGVEWWAS